MGIQLDLGHWTDNVKAIELVYNADKDRVYRGLSPLLPPFSLLFI